MSCAVAWIACKEKWPGAVLQYLVEKERARPVQRRLRRHVQGLLEHATASATASVERRDGKGGKRGVIEDITATVGIDGPAISLNDGATETASTFTSKPQAWPAHLFVIEQPKGTPLNPPVSYEAYIGSSHRSIDAGDETPEGLFEYSSAEPSVPAVAPSDERAHDGGALSHTPVDGSPRKRRCDQREADYGATNAGRGREKRGRTISNKTPYEIDRHRRSFGDW